MLIAYLCIFRQDSKFIVHRRKIKKKKKEYKTLFRQNKNSKINL